MLEQIAVAAAIKIKKEPAPPFVDEHSTLQLRVGVHTGLVLLGEIWISHDTYRHGRGIFEIRQLDPITVKGKAEPLHVYLVCSLKPRPFRVFARGVEGVETHMVGRSTELRHL